MSDVTLLVIRPHPDDESSATGGLLAWAAERGLRTGVVCCTGGEEGEIHDPDLDPVADFPRLREIREQELRNACAVLGVSELRLLGYRDSGMKGTDANGHPEAFCNAGESEAAARLAAIVRELRPAIVVTETEGGGYEHPDHVRCFSVTMDALPLAANTNLSLGAHSAWSVTKVYAIAQIDDGRWAMLLPEFKAAGMDTSFLERRRDRPQRAGPETATVALDVTPYSEVQRRALLQHRTQIQPDHFFVKLPEELRRRAFSTAYFVRLQPPASPGEREQSVLDGLEVAVAPAG